MMKHVLLAGAMTFAVPALAQTAPQSTAPQAGATMSQPATADTGAQAAVTGPSTGVMPATSGQTAQSATPSTATDPNAAQPAQTAAAQPAAGGDQVASVVDNQFGTYDKNGDGKLSKAEFGDWMTALKQAGDPNAKPDAAYNTAAFAQADKDKSKTVTKAEAEKFLKAGQSS